MNSNMVKAEKFGHLHLVYHFIVPLNNGNIIKILKKHRQIRSFITTAASCCHVNALDDTSKERKCRKVMVKECFLKRDTLGAYNTILTELHYR